MTLCFGVEGEKLVVMWLPYADSACRLALADGAGPADEYAGIRKIITVSSPTFQMTE